MTIPTTRNHITVDSIYRSLKNLLLPIYLLVNMNCASFQQHDPFPIQPNQQEESQSTTPMEKFPEGFEKLTNHQKLDMIRVQKNNEKEASRKIQLILEKRYRKRNELEQLED